MAYSLSRLAPLFALGAPLLMAGCAGGFDTGLSLDNDSAAARVASAAQNLTELADSMRQNGNLAGAAAMYRQAHTLNPNDVAPLIALGDVLTEIGQTTQAAQAYGMAQAMEPRNAQPLLGLGTASIAMAQPKFAATQFAAALAADREDVRAYNGLGVASDLAGDHEAAQTSYRAGLALDPNNRALLNNLGLSLALSGNRSEAISLLEQLAKAPGATPLNRQNLALAYGLAGQMDQAAQVARIDLDEGAVQQNLAYYASNQGAESRALVGALGVELRGVRYDSPGTAAPAIGATAQEEEATQLAALAPAAGGAGDPGVPQPSPDRIGLVESSEFPGALPDIVRTELAPLPELAEAEQATVEGDGALPETISGFVETALPAAVEDAALDEIAPAAGPPVELNTVAVARSEPLTPVIRRRASIPRDAGLFDGIAAFFSRAFTSSPEERAAVRAAFGLPKGQSDR